MDKTRVYFSKGENVSRFMNRWDFLLLLLLFAILFFLGWASSQMAVPYQIGKPLAISLHPAMLPFYALKTTLRLFIALAISLLFTLIVGSLAAKNRRAEQVIIPALDILQSVPVLSFLSITVTGFIHLFPNRLLGPECACIFVIFTAQVWNMTFGFYQSLKTVPHDLKEAAAMFQLSAWQCFWKVELPFSMPSLLWNMMMSMSASWFFVVLSEAIVVAHQDIRLPGLGSYIALCIEQHDLVSLGFAIFTMIVVIFLYDQLFFRPLVTWSEKFRVDQSVDEQSYHSWLIDFFRDSALMKRIGSSCAVITDKLINVPFLRRKPKMMIRELKSPFKKQRDYLWNIFLIGLLTVASLLVMRFILSTLAFQDITHVFLLGLATGSRVIILIALSSVIWIPVGVWIGLKPRLAQRIQPIIQLVAAFPANLFYPLFVIAIVRFHLNTEIWLTPLMILGTQWYILFNVIAGAASIPRELYLAAENVGLKGWLWWKRLGFPGIYPFYITGAITAAGGAWNASIVAEWVSWGSTTLHATGLGAYIQAATLAGNFQKIALGTTMMCLFVLSFNHLIWRPLYKIAEERFNFN